MELWNLENIFVYQPVFNTFELKKGDKNTEYIIGWKSKASFESKLLSLHGVFLPNKIFWMQNRNTIQ